MVVLRLSPVTRYRLNIQVIPLSDLESEVVVRIQEERHAGGDDWEYILPTEKKLRRFSGAFAGA